ncbi:hypothetical protein [Erythrobacter sp.]|uniref:hypothetical protein n=1 Tax=Sphingomonadales TaxID=204457 RepID=UPI0032671377
MTDQPDDRPMELLAADHARIVKEGEDENGQHSAFRMIRAMIWMKAVWRTASMSCAILVAAAVIDNYILWHSDTEPTTRWITVIIMSVIFSVIQLTARRDG